MNTISYFTQSKTILLRLVMAVVLVCSIAMLSLSPSYAAPSYVVPPPANDEFPGDIITALPYPTPVAGLDVSGADNDATDPEPIAGVGDCDSSKGDNTVWYNYTPSETEYVHLDTLGSTYDTLIAVWTGTSGAETLVACNDMSPDVSDGTSALTFKAEATVTYYIEVIKWIDWSPVSGSEVAPANFLYFHMKRANTEVYIGGNWVGGYEIQPGNSERVSYSGLNDGPVKISNSDGSPMIASVRPLLLHHPFIASYSEIMGIPEGDLTDTYIFPWYNNETLATQLRFGNVGDATTYVTVTIGGDDYGPYELGKDKAFRISYPGLNDGPVEVKSSGGVPIIASMRPLLLHHAAISSYSEFVGLPSGETAGTAYVFPWYNNETLATQLRFGNVGDATTYVTVTIGGDDYGPYELGKDKAFRISYPGLNDGPVEVKSSGGVPIIASMRPLLLHHPFIASYFEFMALPGETLTETTYVFPWYNNETLATQLRFGNVGDATTYVTVTIGGDDYGPYELGKDKAFRISYPGLNDGPVEVKSSGGVPIIASMRPLLLHHPFIASYFEFMGLSVGDGYPTNQLSTTYWAPWYNNETLRTQLRFGVP